MNGSVFVPSQGIQSVGGAPRIPGDPQANRSQFVGRQIAKSVGWSGRATCLQNASVPGKLFCSAPDAPLIHRHSILYSAALSAARSRSGWPGSSQTHARSRCARQAAVGHGFRDARLGQIRSRVWRRVHTRFVSDDLPIPPGLSRLIEAGVWPSVDRALAQSLHPVVAPQDVGRLAIDEESLFLDPPPFSTLADEVATNPHFWLEHGALGEIDPDRALIIGDFGSGSDAAIVLDYRRSHDEPAVLRLAWGSEGNHWVEISPTFESFARVLGLA